MVVYSNLHGNLDIPFTLQVPSSPWPTWSWQQKLNTQTRSIRTGNMKLSDKENDVLESLHFEWDPKGGTPSKTKHHSTRSSSAVRQKNI